MPDWTVLRWSWISNVGGVAATGSSMILSAPAVVTVRANVISAFGTVAVYDATNTPTNQVMVLGPTVGAPDTFPRDGEYIKLEKGLYVSYSMGTGVIGVGVGRLDR